MIIYSAALADTKKGTWIRGNNLWQEEQI
jgi:hypothetical protein